MAKVYRCVVGLLFLILLAILAGPAGAQEGSVKQLARQLVSQSGVSGGFVVHLGCGDGRLTAALRVDDRFTVHGLDNDPAAIEAARQYITETGLYGPVSAELITGNRLPYSDNLINLLVVEKDCGISSQELQRVVVPTGVAMIKTAQGWRKLVKPRPGSIDNWNHFLHDAGNNAVAQDTEVGPPRCLQWVGPPLWLRSHETPSGVQGLVCSGKRIFYFFDEGIIGITDQRLPERWSLVARDAFNGKLLWKRKLENWGWPAWAPDRFQGISWTQIRGGRTVVPDENHRRLVCDDQYVYTTLRYNGPLVILDAATGKTLHELPQTEPARQILLCDGVLLVYSGSVVDADRSRRRGEEPPPHSLFAIEPASGKVVWHKQIAPIVGLSFAACNGRVFYQSGNTLFCLDLRSGDKLWEAGAPKGRPRTMIALPDHLVLYVQNVVATYSAADGRKLWEQQVPPSSGSESPDLFVVDGVVWRGMVPVDSQRKPVGKSENVLALGFDLESGKLVKTIFVPKLRSPEHHHRCYRNKATLRFIISGMEGAEFLDLQDSLHCQNNWARGACRLGIMPCNGLLYVPPDQCFCQPGAKLLGFLALAAERKKRFVPVPDQVRLEKGPAYGLQLGPSARKEDWPTFRHDSARHGSTNAVVGTELKPVWRVRLGHRLTQPVAVGDKVYVAAVDAHTLFALDGQTGKLLWSFVAGGRIDSPPTYYKGLLLFGCADGRAYCVRAEDGRLVWRFLAAPVDIRVGDFDQLASVWPVHGSVLVWQDKAYVAAGRSTYLDGGIYLWALDPASGKILARGKLGGPFPQVPEKRDYAFYLLGANSDVLVAEGDFIYMRQKKLTADLKEIVPPVLSSKGAQDVGLHVFSTASLLDGSWYNRAFWMYAKRWPGFQLAQQAPKAGQLLVVDDRHTYAVKVYYLRNVHSPMFFPGTRGYLLYADHNTTEPQIVGEPGWRQPVEWLPQSHIPRPGNPGLTQVAFGQDKGIGYTRAEPPVWMSWLPIRIRAMVKAADMLFVAGPPDELDPEDPYAAFEGRKGAVLAAVDPANGKTVARYQLDTPPVFDGMIAVPGRLLVSLTDGSLLCLSSQ